MAEFKHTAVINAPVETVFRKVLDYEFLARTLEQVKSVERTGENTSHWVMEVGGMRVESEVELCRREENRLLVWRSVTGPEFTDEIRFEDLGDGRTRVEYFGTYQPEGMISGLMSRLLQGPAEKEMEKAADEIKEAIEQEAAA